MICRYRIRYADKQSHGSERITYFDGDVSESEVIDFFGLRKSDVYWYKVEKMFNYN